MTRQHAESLFFLAGFEILSATQIPNDYWPMVGAYEEIRRDNPWFLVKTLYGDIKIGWRKRVISIEWDGCGVEAKVTEDDTTQDRFLVHAWSYHKAVEYLTALRAALRAAKAGGK
jgi:hypothetical protein